MSDSPYTQLIVGTDGSETAQRAVERAAWLAQELGAGLVLATAWYRDMPDSPVLSELVEYPGGSVGAHESTWAEMTVSDAAAVARQAGLDEVETATPLGTPADALIGLTAGRVDRLLVVGTVGLSSRAERLLGNVPHQVTHHAPGDVLLVHTTARDGTPYRQVALATDGSETATLAAQRGLTVARPTGARVTLLTVARSERAGAAALDRTAAALADGEFDRVVVTARQAGDALVEAGTDYDLLVVGNKGMSGPSRLLGSVANQVTHRVPTNLLLVNTTRQA